MKKPGKELKAQNKMFCPKCAKEILENSSFCKFCGFKIKKEKINFFSYIKNNYSIILILIIIFYIILRLRYLFIESLWPDEAVYMWYGYSIFKNPLYLFSGELWKFHPPLFSIIGAFFNIFFNKEIAARIVSPLFGLAGVILIYILGKELKNRLAGILAAIMLTMNHLFWFLSDRILLDVPLTTMCLASVYFIIKYDKTKIKKYFIFSILSITGTLLIKRVGFMILPFVIFYFSYKKLKKSDKKSIQKLVVLFALLSIAIIFIYYLNPLLFDVNIRNVLKLNNLTSITQIQIVFLLSWYILIFTIIGAAFSLFYRQKHDYILFFYLISVLGFRIMIGSTELPRLILPALPPLLLFASLGILEIRELVKSFFKLNIHGSILIIIVILISIPSLIQGEALNKSKTYSYTGFKEAGEFLKINANKDSIIIASSGRQIRPFSEFEYKENGGVIEWDYITQDQSKFEETINQNKTIFLEMDVWEYTQPNWIYPLNQEKALYLESLGFELVKVIEKEYPTQEGPKKTPVIFIFKKS